LSVGQLLNILPDLADGVWAETFLAPDGLNFVVFTVVSPPVAAMVLVEKIFAAGKLLD
jgi:hypothetical protein